MVLPTSLLNNLRALRATFSTYVRKRYALVIIVDILCLFLMIFSQGINSNNLLFSPLATPNPLITQILAENYRYERFSFIPGWTTAKLDNIDLNSADIFAFFDIPVLPDGMLYQDTPGYSVFIGYQAYALFRTIKENNKRVVVTITQSDNGEIKQILSSENAQETLIQQITEEVIAANIDGVNIDFEFTDLDGNNYRNQFTTFVKRLDEKMRERLPHALVVVSLPNTAPQQPFYDLTTLAQYVDKTFLMAFNFPVSENFNTTTIPPIYGCEKGQYWTTVFKDYAEFLKFVPAQKIALEAAWYGNGNNYPFKEIGNEDIADEIIIDNDLKTPLSQATIERILVNVPLQARSAAEKNLPYIAKALEEENILNSNVLAYALATIEHETAGTFEPIEEFNGRKNARRLGYEGGTYYFGRGFIQLTHLRNYLRIGRRIGFGEQLVQNPELALRPDISAKILAAFFKDNGIAKLASSGYFVDARIAINPDHQGYYIAMLAWGYGSGIY